MKSRGGWIESCGFHDLEDSQVLREVESRVRETRSPLVLLDLDSTLYEVAPRTHEILLEWLATPEARSHGGIRDRIERVTLQHVGYSLKDTFAALGLDLQAPEAHRAWESAKSFWFSRFFSSDYLKFDRAYEGAAAFCQRLHRLGAGLIYLTGRDEPNMGKGTRENLIRDGFPWNVERTHLLLKPAPELSDLAHKQEAARYVRERGTLVASFENEPQNLVAIQELFPEAMHVFVDTMCSDKPARPGQGLYRLRGFLTS